MDTTLSAADFGDRSWGDRRGFWTKRKKTATSLFAVMAMLAGIAVAFKLFDQVVPNNVVRDASNFDFAVEVFRSPDGILPPAWLAAGGDPGEVPIFSAGVDQFPGDARTENVRIRNTNLTPAKDATFFVYVDPFSLEVRDDVAGVIASVNPLWTRFVNFWTLSVTKEKILFADGAEVNENDHSLTNPPPDLDDHDKSRLNQHTQVCSGGLRTITQSAPCNLGTIRAAGSTEPTLVDGPLQPTDTRWYRFTMSEADDGSDQSQFKGWTLTFTLVFQARVPAIPASGLAGER